MKTLEDNWKEFYAMVNPSVPIESKDAFFSGAAIVLSLLNSSEATFDALVEECVQFSNEALLENMSNPTVN